MLLKYPLLSDWSGKLHQVNGTQKWFFSSPCMASPIIMPCKHLWVFYPFGLLILHCGPASLAWHNSSLVFPIKTLNFFLSQLLIVYTRLCVFCSYSLPVETSCSQVTKSLWIGSLQVVTAVTLCSTNGVIVYR